MEVPMEDRPMAKHLIDRHPLQHDRAWSRGFRCNSLARAIITDLLMGNSAEGRSKQSADFKRREASHRPGGLLPERWSPWAWYEELIVCTGPIGLTDLMGRLRTAQDPTALTGHTVPTLETIGEPAGLAAARSE
jgi:hypothetical protein